MNCLLCNKLLTPHQVYEVVRGKMVGYCSRKCRDIKLRKQESKPCENCGKIMTKASNQIKKVKVCSMKCAGDRSSKRMTENNPMKMPGIREKVSEALKKMGHKPPVLGGNGRGMTIYQEALLNRLGTGWRGEYIEGHTHQYAKEYGCPNHYKIDIANKKKLIAIEVDGASHNSLKGHERDKKKDTVLCLLKWKVLRFTNKQIEKDLSGCVQKVLSMI